MSQVTMDDLHNLILQQQQQTWQKGNQLIGMATLLGHFALVMGSNPVTPNYIPTRFTQHPDFAPPSIMGLMMIPHYIYTYIHKNDIQDLGFIVPKVHIIIFTSIMLNLSSIYHFNTHTHTHTHTYIYIPLQITTNKIHILFYFILFFLHLPKIFKT